MASKHNPPEEIIGLPKEAGIKINEGSAVSSAVKAIRTIEQIHNP